MIVQLWDVLRQNVPTAALLLLLLSFVIQITPIKINPWSWGYDASHGVVKAWNMNEGKVGFYMYPAEISYENNSFIREQLV